MCKSFIMTYYGMYEPDVACSTSYGLVFKVKAIKIVLIKLQAICFFGL